MGVSGDETAQKKKQRYKLFGVHFDGSRAQLLAFRRPQRRMLKVIHTKVAVWRRYSKWDHERGVEELLGRPFSDTTFSRR